MLNKGLIGKTFSKKAPNIFEHFDQMKNSDKEAFKALTESKEIYKFKTECGEEYEIDPKMVSKIKCKTVNVTEEKFVPWVIEPSFGFGRILFALLEHSYMVRDGKQLLKFPSNVAPVKVSILPLFAKEEFLQHLKGLEKSIKQYNLSTKVDKTGVNIGKKYARNDEIGVPYAVTVDHTTNEDQTVTLRDCVSQTQVRIPKTDVARELSDLCNGVIMWTDVQKKWPGLEDNSKKE